MAERLIIKRIVKSIEDLSLAFELKRCNLGAIIRATVLAVLTTKLFACIH